MQTESHHIHRISPDRAKKRNIVAPLFWLASKWLFSIDSLSKESEENLLTADRLVDKSSLIIYTNPISDLNHLTAVLTLLTTYLSTAKSYAFSSRETNNSKVCSNKFKLFIKALEWLHVYIIHSTPTDSALKSLVFDLLTMNGGVYITDSHNQSLQEQIKSIPVPIYFMPVSIKPSKSKHEIIVGNPQTISSNRLTQGILNQALITLEKKKLRTRC